MCGRYSLTDPVEALRRLFGVTAPNSVFPRYNIAPSQVVPVLRRSADGAREVALLRWGLVPSWAKDIDIGNRMINARSETAAEKPAFRAAMQRRRCLVPADGFYEWQGPQHGKQPYRIVIGEGDPFAMAGLWEEWQAPTGDVLETFAILTTEATASIAEIHHRMPVILSPDEYDTWLDATQAADTSGFAGRPTPGLHGYPVSTHVNRPANDDPACLEGVDLPAAPPPPPPPKQGELF
jgi:putative SOS response-associated peptidase YedK